MYVKWTQYEFTDLILTVFVQMDGSADFMSSVVSADT